MGKRDKPILDSVSAPMRTGAFPACNFGGVEDMGLKLKPTKEELEELYWQKKLNLKEIGQMFGVCSTTILNWMKTYGVQRRKQPYSDQELKILKQMYPTSTKEEILAKVNRPWEAIVRKMGELKIYRGSLRPSLDKLPNLKLDEKDKVWLACAIDCEGSVGVSYSVRASKPNRTTFYFPFISVNNTKKVFLNHFRKLVGCAYKKIKIENKRYENRKNLYQLDMASAPWIYALLKQIRPYFIIKGKQADLVMEFIEIIDNIKRNNNGRIVYTERVHEIYRELKRLNKRGKV
jgi:hypothetical protein